MVNKIIVERLDNGQIKEFKSLTAVKRDPEFSEIEYHQLREIYLYNTGRVQRNLHTFNKHLLSKLKIIDNPKIKNVLKQSS